MPAPLTPEEKNRRERLGGRIREYRLRAGLTLDALGNRVGERRAGGAQIDRREVAKWESGNAQLPDDLLHEIAEVLRVDRWTMTYLPEPILPRRARLIGMSADRNISTMEQRQIEAKMMHAVRVSAERLYGAKRIPRFYDPVVFRTSAAFDGQQAESMAAKVRARWKLGHAPIADVVQTMEERQVTVTFDEANRSETVVISAILAKWPVVCWSGSPPADFGERCEFRLRMLAGLLRTMALSRGLLGDDAGEQAAIVARAVLLPHDRILYHFGGRNSVTAQNIRALSGRYGLPVGETVTRLVETGAVPEHVGTTLKRATASAAPLTLPERPLRGAILPPPI